MDSTTPPNSNEQRDGSFPGDSVAPSSSDNRGQKGGPADTLLPLSTLSQLYRFAWLLTGSPVRAEGMLLPVFEQSAQHLGQLRSERHRTAFLVSRIREQSNQSPREENSEAASTGFATQFSSLPEPARSALALFYLDLFPVEELAALLNLDLEELSAPISSGRELLGYSPPQTGGESSKPKKGAQLLPFYRPEKADPGDAKIAKAIKNAENDPALKAQLEAQVAFDAGCLKQISEAEPPAALLERIALAAQSTAKGVGLSGLKQPAFLSVGFALIVVIGVLLYFTLNRIHRFEGQENVMELLDTTEAMSGVELEPKATKLGLLGDWLFSKYAFENFKVPSQFSDFQTVGCRVFKQNGKRVAQIAVEPENLIFFLFQPGDFGVRLRSKDGWRTFEQDGWAGAVRVYEGTCVMIAMAGDKDDIEATLSKIDPKK